MLPGTGGVLVPHDDRIPALQRTDAVGDDAVRRPVAPADGIASTCGGKADARAGC